MTIDENRSIAFAQTSGGFAVYGPAGPWKPDSATPPCNRRDLSHAPADPHVASDNHAIEKAQRSIADNLLRSFDAAVADFRRRPNLSRLRRIVNVGESVVDHAMRELREGRGQ